MKPSSAAPSGPSESSWTLPVGWLPHGQGVGNGGVTVSGTLVPGESCFHPKEKEPSPEAASQVAAGLRVGKRGFCRGRRLPRKSQRPGGKAPCTSRPCVACCLWTATVWEAGGLWAGRGGGRCSPLPVSSLLADLPGCGALFWGLGLPTLAPPFPGGPGRSAGVGGPALLAEQEATLFPEGARVQASGAITEWGSPSSLLIRGGRGSLGTVVLWVSVHFWSERLKGVPGSGLGAEAPGCLRYSLGLQESQNFTGASSQ